MFLFFSGVAVQAEPCLARKLLADIGQHYVLLHSVSEKTKRDAARELERLFPSNDYRRFALQLSAEGYAVPPSLLIRSFSQIDLDISAIKAGLPIQPIQASVRRVLPSMLAGTECPSPLSDLPTMVAAQKSIGGHGTAKNAASSNRTLNAQHAPGMLLPLWLPSAPTQLVLTLVAVLCSLTAAAFLFSQRLRRVFGRRSRLKRRSWTAELLVTHQQGDDVENLTVSCVDISTGGMKFALNQADNLLQVGSQIELHLPGRNIWATIMWSNKFYCGVAFQKRLSNRAFRQITGGR